MTMMTTTTTIEKKTELTPRWELTEMDAERNMVWGEMVRREDEKKNEEYQERETIKE